MVVGDSLSAGPSKLPLKPESQPTAGCRREEKDCCADADADAGADADADEQFWKTCDLLRS